jgi:ABC-type methionine transport system ATPase subunit
VHLLSQPLIYQLIRQYDLFTNILEAQVTSETGRLTLSVRGESEKVQQGLSWLAEQGVQVEISGEAA